MVLARADFVAQDAEDDSAGCPADEHQRGGDTAVIVHVGMIGCKPQKRGNRRFSRNVEKLLAHAVEDPAEGADGQDKPLIAVQFIDPSFAIAFSANRSAARWSIRHEQQPFYNREIRFKPIALPLPMERLLTDGENACRYFIGWRKHVQCCWVEDTKERQRRS